MGEGCSRAHERTLVGIIPGPWSDCGRRSVKQKAVQILADAFRAILSRMRRSFVDRQYTPSTGMDQSEWEIILGELIRMGFLVKQEPLSEGDD
jgi:hypothetical protein